MCNKYSFGRECPFCGETIMLEFYHDDSATDKPISVLCRNCGAMGPYADTKEEAASGWDSRITD